MREFLNKIRKAETSTNLSAKVISSILILSLGVALGVLSKWLDNMAIDDTVWWQHLLGILDLRNVFSSFTVWLLLALAISVYSKSPIRASLNVFLFFVGMCSSYHLYTIVFSGFNPKSYMLIWYGITMFSPVLAFVCWFGKGKTKISLMIDILILSIMLSVCFSIGIWYFGFISLIDTLIFIIAVFILYSTPKYTVFSLLGAVILAFCFRIFI